MFSSAVKKKNKETTVNFHPRVLYTLYGMYTTHGETSIEVAIPTNLCSFSNSEHNTAINQSKTQNLTLFCSSVYHHNHIRRPKHKAGLCHFEIMAPTYPMLKLMCTGTRQQVPPLGFSSMRYGNLSACVAGWSCAFLKSSWDTAL